MPCHSEFRPVLHYRNRRPPVGTVECEMCDGDGVVDGDCSCGRCESPPEVRCETCGGAGYVDAPDLETDEEVS